MIDSRLGELLLREQLIDSKQLDQGLAAQLTSGGRIGTNLVELGVLAVDDLGDMLGQQHGVPVATMELFEGVTSGVLGAVPREVCVRFNVVPLKVADRTLHVAMMDPHQLTLVDKLGAAVSQTIQPYAAPQLRLLYYLERYYNVPRHERFLRIPDRRLESSKRIEGDRRRYLEPSVGVPSSATGPRLPRVQLPRVEQRPVSGLALPKVQLPPIQRPGSVKAKPAAAPAPPVAAPHPPAPVGADSAPEMQLVTLDEFASESAFDLDLDVDFDVEVQVDESVQTRPQTGPRTPLIPRSPSAAEERPAREASGAAPLPAKPAVRKPPPIAIPARARKLTMPDVPAGMLGLEEALTRIDRVTSRQALVKQMIHPVLPETSLNLLTLVRGDVAIAMGAWGTELSPSLVRALVLPLGMDSLLRKAYEERVVVRAPAMQCRLQKMIAVYLRKDVPVEACITPVCFDGKVVNLICAHTTAAFRESAVGDLLTLAARASAAYKRLMDELRGAGKGR